MNLEKLFHIKNGGEVSASECKEINKALAQTEIEDLPNDQYENVKSYVLRGLNYNSVDAHLAHI